MQNDLSYSIVRRAKGGWDVQLKPPGYGEPIEIMGFKSERQAQTWAEREAFDWLTRHRVAA
jgi:hypothetical protein